MKEDARLQCVSSPAIKIVGLFYFFITVVMKICRRDRGTAEKGEIVMKNRKTNIYVLVSVSLLSALSSVLMFFSISIPLVPSFLKIDISELPALIAAFTVGPVAGVTVCLVKNIVNLLATTTGGVGELCNFLLGASFVVPAGLIYKRMKNRPGALLGGFAGALLMSIVSFPINYYIIYPFYTQFMPMEAIMGMYQAIRPSTDSLAEALVVFNMPFTFAKGVIDIVLAFAIYKPLAPVINGCYFKNKQVKKIAGNHTGDDPCDI
jgi:riboflavin transporter FmnP